MKLENVMIAGLLFFLCISAMAIFAGAITPSYDNAITDASFNSTYNKFNIMAENTKEIQSNLLKNDSVEGDPASVFNFIDAFLTIKDAFLKLPSILVSSFGLLFDGSSGAIVSIGGRVGIPPALTIIVVTLGLLLVLMAIIKSILGRR